MWCAQTGFRYSPLPAVLVHTHVCTHVHTHVLSGLQALVLSDAPSGFAGPEACTLVHVSTHRTVYTQDCLHTGLSTHRTVNTQDCLRTLSRNACAEMQKHVRAAKRISKHMSSHRPLLSLRTRSVQHRSTPSQQASPTATPATVPSPIPQCPRACAFVHSLPHSAVAH